MWVMHRNCPNCGDAIEEDFTSFLCFQCGTFLYTDISEEELKQSGSKYRVVDTSQMHKRTEEEEAYFAELEQHIGNMGNKPVRLIKMKTPAPDSMKKTSSGLLWLVFFTLLFIAMIIILILIFDWYVLIPGIGITLISLYTQKRS